MSPLSASKKLLAAGYLLAQHPRELRFAIKWAKSLLPNRSPLSEEIPWVTFRAIEWLGACLKPDMSVFEYGAGGSTLFLARRARAVVSVEHDDGFHAAVAQVLATRKLDNCTLLLRKPERLADGQAVGYSTSSFTSAQAKYAGLSFERYVKAIDAYPDRSFDLVLVDGRARASCVARAIPKVKPGGHLLLDNSERRGYAGALELLQSYPRIDHFGIVPWNLETYQTSVWQIAGMDPAGSA